MCLYPKLIINRKYLPNKKNGGNPPKITDERTKYVPVGCQECMECRKQKSRDWQIRLSEEIRSDNTGKFVTMTFSEESLIELEQAVDQQRQKQHEEINKLTKKKIKPYTKLTGYELENAIATIAVRRFLERYRKEYKTSVKHWLVTELGEKKTERIHIHGIIFTNIPKSKLEKIWKYGNLNKQDKTWKDNYVSERTVNYVVKYITKKDELHRHYKPIILTSTGIGRNYINRPDSKLNKFKEDKTNETYTNRQGYKMSLPIYYRNKIYTEEQKEKLWTFKLDKEIRYVNGIKIDISKNEDDYYNVLKEQRIINKQLGYGDNKIDYDRKSYEQHRRNIKRLTRLNKLKENQNHEEGVYGGNAED